VQNAYFVGNIDAEKVMIFKSAQCSSDVFRADNPLHRALVPRVSAESVKEAPFHASD
jgi:hypothetical protein